MNKKLSLVLVALVGLSSAGFATLPAQAAPAICNDPTNQVLDPINDDPAPIAQRLADMGVKVSGVEDFGGCIRAYVTNKDGTQSMAYFTPDTLKRIKVGGV
ncbi:MAG TPA: PepSY domain-containing protein [Arsenicitalea sp.]|jgi:hypothetical protein|nr:PepSY domain-containing protein [Arsenicitalea sp.]